MPVKSITVMVQKEVAMRMQAGRAPKVTGHLSLAVPVLCRAIYRGKCTAKLLYAASECRKCGHRLTLHENPPTTVKDESLMFRIIRASFNQRRKTLLNGLNNSPEIAATKEQIQTAFEKLGFPANVRGETLTLKEFAALADEFAEF